MKLFSMVITVLANNMHFPFWWASIHINIYCIYDVGFILRLIFVDVHTVYWCSIVLGSSLIFIICCLYDDECSDENDVDYELPVILQMQSLMTLMKKKNYFRVYESAWWINIFVQWWYIYWSAIAKRSWHLNWLLIVKLRILVWILI